METVVSTCSICLETVKADVFSTVSPCRHNFCLPCIQGWLAQKSQCPNCQKEVIDLEYTDTTGKKVLKAVEIKKEAANQPEDFECLDHDHFLDQYERLLAKAEQTEFDIKCLLNLKRNATDLEESYAMITQIMYEIELKLSFLEKRKKIDPKSLVEDVHHFSDLLSNFVVKCKGFEKERYDQYCDDDYGDDNYYDQYVTQDNQDIPVINMKLSKNKSKKKGKKAKKMAESSEGFENNEVKTELKALC